MAACCAKHVKELQNSHLSNLMLIISLIFLAEVKSCCRTLARLQQTGIFQVYQHLSGNLEFSTTTIRMGFPSYMLPNSILCRDQEIMRPNNHNKQRMRGRSRKGANPSNRTYDSNGPDVKVRGNAHHIAEKYQQLARDAQAGGDRIMAENYLQHAEHYSRIIASANSHQTGNSRINSEPVESSTAETTEDNPVSEPVIVENVSDRSEPEETTINNVQTEDQSTDSNGKGDISEDIYDVKESSNSLPDEGFKPRRRTVSPRGRGVRRSPISRGRNSSQIRRGVRE